MEESRPGRSGRFVAWGNAALAGLVSPDTAAERISGTADGRHRVWGELPGVPTPAPATGELGGVTLPVLLAALRRAQVPGLLLALPVPGDPLGLPGPPEFNSRALDAGQAVLTGGDRPFGLVPEVLAEDPDGPLGQVVLWHAFPVSGVPAGLPSLAEAERELAETMREVTAALAELDVARWRPEAAARITAIRDHAGADGLAPGYPGRAHRVLAQAQRLTAIAELAAEDPGAATSAGAIAERAAWLRPLARAARRAQVAAFNAAVEPTAGRLAR